MADLRNFEKWCRSRLTRMQGQPVDAKIAQDVARYIGAITALSEYQETINAHSKPKNGKSH